MNATPHRVAYASVVDDALVLGHPSGTHVTLTRDRVRALEEADGGTVTLWDVPWDAVRAVTVDAPESRVRHPGRLTGSVMGLATAAGLDWEPATAPVRVHVQTEEGARKADCTGYMGRGYHRPRARALAVLLDLLVTDDDVRARLADPVSLLTQVVAASASSTEAEMRMRLTG